LFFLTNRFNPLIFSIIKFHSLIGYNSKQGWNTERFKTNPSWREADNCFFKGAGKSSLPLASTLHSYVPIIEVKINRIDYRYKNSYFLPLSTTIYHFVNKFYHLNWEKKSIKKLVKRLFDKLLRKIVYCSLD
jgi:hypothetical protein